MGPLVIGVGLVGTYLLLKGSGSAPPPPPSPQGQAPVLQGGVSAPLQPGQENMAFTNYAWTTLLPSTETLVPSVGPGTLPATIPLGLPPPPGVTSPGHWAEYPQGYHPALTSIGSAWSQSQIASGQKPAPGAPGNPIIPAFPNIPAGLSVFLWVPGTQANSPTTGTTQIYQINGYYVCNNTFTWTGLTSANANTKATDQKIFANGGIAPYGLSWICQKSPPPPPGQTSKSGKWHGIAPGYLVWLTPQNTNDATQAVQAFNDPQLASFLAQSGAGGGNQATNPTFSGQPTPAAALRPSQGAPGSPPSYGVPVAQPNSGQPGAQPSYSGSSGGSGAATTPPGSVSSYGGATPGYPPAQPPLGYGSAASGGFSGGTLGSGGSGTSLSGSDDDSDGGDSGGFTSSDSGMGAAGSSGDDSDDDDSDDSTSGPLYDRGEFDSTTGAPIYRTAGGLPVIVDTLGQTWTFCSQ